MRCDTLPDIGAPALLVLAAVAAVCLVTGALLVTLARRQRVAPALLLLVIAGVGYGTVAGEPAQASSVECETSSPGRANAIRITQTSVLEGLAPDVAPIPITGIVKNDADDDTYITAITISISSVKKHPDAVAGTCDVSDYLLTDPRMPIGRRLGPHESIQFSGASISFNNKSVNQDACKHATLRLRYVSPPSVEPPAA